MVALGGEFLEADAEEAFRLVNVDGVKVEVVNLDLGREVKDGKDWNFGEFFSATWFCSCNLARETASG